MLTSFVRLIRTYDCSALPEFFSLGTMASADFLQFVVTTHFFRICLLDAPARPPRVLTHSFPLYLPYLPQPIPCSYWTLTYRGVLSSAGALYMISVRQARVLPPSFFRFHLTMDTLDLNFILPTAGRIRDFHPLECALTGRTRMTSAQTARRFFLAKRESFPIQQIILDKPAPAC